MVLFEAWGVQTPELLQLRGRNYALLGLSVDKLNAIWHKNVGTDEDRQALLTGYLDASRVPVAGAEGTITVPEVDVPTLCQQLVQEFDPNQFKFCGSLIVSSLGDDYFIPGIGSTVYCVFKHTRDSYLVVASFSRCISTDGSFNDSWAFDVTYSEPVGSHEARRSWEHKNLQYKINHRVNRPTSKVRCCGVSMYGHDHSHVHFEFTEHQGAGPKDVAEATIQCHRVMRDSGHLGWGVIRTKATSVYVGPSYCHKSFDDSTFWDHFDTTGVFKE